MTKEHLDQSIRELSMTVKGRENGYPTSEQLFRAAEILLDNQNIVEAIKEHYPNITDIKGFVTNSIS